MAAKPQKCAECGVELRLDAATCPLCGGATGIETAERTRSARKLGPVRDIDQYQAGVRELRERLKKLRDDEAKGA